MKSKGRLEEAEEMFKKAIEVNNNSKKAYLMLEEYLNKF